MRMTRKIGLVLFLILGNTFFCQSAKAAIIEFRKLKYECIPSNFFEGRKKLLGIEVYEKNEKCPVNINGILFIKLIESINCEKRYCDTIAYLEEEKLIIFYSKTVGKIAFSKNYTCSSKGCFFDICANTKKGATLFRFEEVGFYFAIESDVTAECGALDH